MLGEGRCSKAPEHAAHAPGHCVHRRARHNDYICCFCGDLFEGDELVSGPHGQHRPRGEREREKRRAAAQ